MVTRELSTMSLLFVTSKSYSFFKEHRAEMGVMLMLTQYRNSNRKNNRRDKTNDSKITMYRDIFGYLFVMI
jgi:hypothetical protein